MKHIRPFPIIVAATLGLSSLLTAQDDEDYTPIRLTDPIPESARIQDPSSGKSDQEQLKDKVSTLLSESEKHPSDEDDPFSTNLD